MKTLKHIKKPLNKIKQPLDKIQSPIKAEKPKFDTLNRIEISKSAILHNISIYKEYNPQAYVFPVLKANAYGHGIEQIAKIVNEINPKYICVDSYFEYTKIKDITDSKILIIGYTKPKNYKNFNFKKIAITVFDLDTIKILGSLNKEINIHLKIDTGMNRQGIYLQDLSNYINIIKQYSKLNIEGIMTHLADADNPITNDYTNEQIKLFKTGIQILKHNNINPKYKHLANSAGGMTIINSEFTALRIGLGMYGYSPLSPEDSNFNKTQNLKPCLKLISTVAQTKIIEKYAKISYNLTYEAENDMRVGIIPIGYYDGVDRRLSNIGYFSQNSHNFRILGRVCMNVSIIDLTSSPTKLGDEITIISNNKESINSVENIAKLCNTIPYVITTKLAESTRRIIVD